MIASPKVEKKEGEKPHACNGVKNSSQMFDRLCLHRIAQGWKPCSKCEHTKRLKGGLRPNENHNIVLEQIVLGPAQAYL